MLRPAMVAVFFGMGALVFAGAHAEAASGATVSGTLELPAASKRPSPPQRSTGYTQRVPHPLMAGKPTEDPFPSMFVVLTGGDAGKEGSEPDRRPVELSLLGQRFERPVIPVLVGQTLILKNDSLRGSNKGVTPRLDAPGHRDIFTNSADAGNPFNPNGERELKVAQPLVPIELRDLDTPHIRTVLVGLPNKFFAVPDASGKFTISGVPEGKWTARVWYDNGWLAGTDTVIDVPARGRQSVKISIPPGMAVQSVGEPGGAESQGSGK